MKPTSRRSIYKTAPFWHPSVAKVSIVHNMNNHPGICTQSCRNTVLSSHIKILSLTSLESESRPQLHLPMTTTALE